MAIKLTDIESLVARFGNKVVTEQANLETPFVGKGTISKMNHSGTVGIVNVKSGGIAATAFIADAGTLPTGDSKKPVQLAYHPKALFSRLTVPRISALTAISKQDGVNIVKEQMETVGADLGRTLGRALFSSSLAVSTHQDAATSTVAYGTLQFAATPAAPLDTTGYRVGARVDGFVDTSAGTALFCEVTAVDHTSGIVTMNVFTDSAMATPYSAGNSIADSGASSPTLRGAGTSGNSITSLLDLADSTVAQGTVTQAGNYSAASASATPEWKGSETAGGTLAISDLETQSRKLKRQSGRPWDVLVMNSTNLGRYSDLLTANSRFDVQIQKTADGSPGSLAFQGKPIIVDENMPDGDILFFTKADTKLAVWRDFKPDSDGKGASMVDSTNLTYDTQIFGLFNVRCTSRNGLGKVNAITG